MKRWRWVEMDVVKAIHDVQIAEHGGLAGISNLDAIESALARPMQLATYGHPDAAAIAAAYAWGIAAGHGFADGNKRVAWLVARIFLADNGVAMIVDAADAVRTMWRVAAKSMTEDELAQWFRERIKPDRAQQRRGHEPAS